MKASGGRRGIRCCIKEQRALAVVACIIQSSVGVVNEVAIITVIGGLHGDEIAVVIIGVLEGLFEVAHRSIFALLFGHIAMLIVFGRDLTALTKIISGLVVARALVIHNVICTIFADSFDVQAIDIHGIEIAGRGLDTAIIRDNFRDGQLMGIIIGIGGGVVQILLTITYGVGLFAQFPAVVIIGVLAHDGRIAIHHVVDAVDNGHTGCPICAGLKVVSSINDLASQCPEAAAMWSSKNKLSASEVAVKSSKKAFFKCRDCGQEFEAAIQNVVRSVGNGFTGCYDCKMRRKNAISKPECFVVRLMLAFAGENGIANPFSDVRSILGENSLLGLDFVDHIQKLCGEYNGVAWHGDDEHVVRDRFKFEAAHKAGYTMIRIQEPGLEVLDPKYDIVMPEGFCRNHKYDAKIMEEVGRKVIHLLEEIYGRKASPEIWALNNFKEFEVWYDTNKKELEANARKKGPKGKTAAKKAA